MTETSPPEPAPLVDPAEIERAIRDELRLGALATSFGDELARLVLTATAPEAARALAAGYIEASRQHAAMRRWRRSAERLAALR